MRTKDIPIASTSLFGGDLRKAVAKFTTASHNYKALGDCFVLFGLPRPKPPRGKKQKVSLLLAFCGEHRPGTARAALNPTGSGRGGGHLAAGAKAPTTMPVSPSNSSGSKHKSKPCGNPNSRPWAQAKRQRLTQAGTGSGPPV